MVASAEFGKILAGLADALELERELGVRTVEIDRGVLESEARAVSPEGRGEDARQEAGDKRREDGRRETPPPTPAPTPAPAPSPSSPLPLLFLHDRALSAGGVGMMAKIVTAMHQTPETAPILFAGERPAARVTVVLGHRALKKWFPNAVGAPGQWISPDGTPNVLVTYSPEYVLRFGSATPAVKKLKMDMWTSLKAALQRMN